MITLPPAGKQILEKHHCESRQLATFLRFEFKSEPYRVQREWIFNNAFPRITCRSLHSTAIAGKYETISCDFLLLSENRTFKNDFSMSEMPLVFQIWVG